MRLALFIPFHDVDQDVASRLAYSFFDNISTV